MFFEKGQYLSAATATIVVSAIAIGQVPPADWKLYAFSKLPEGTVALFYSDPETRRSPDGHDIRVWVKALDEKELEHARDVMSKPMLERAAQKIAHYYMPPITTVRETTNNQLLDVVLFEQLADDADLQPRMRILFELDCLGRMERTLSLQISQRGTFRGGDVSPPNPLAAWEHTAPETPIAHLMSILCPVTPTNQ